ncbi:MAG: hypothetical protein CMG66_03800 [Candidatus Marinimicrobia bacterium]|nr:hypothetical protein [Candidatus Neomarinimicrobiota bacterium]
MIKTRKTKLQILWSMRKWSIKYINWRLITAYPDGLKYAIRHPLELCRDFWNYLIWCQEIDKDIN